MLKSILVCLLGILLFLRGNAQMPSVTEFLSNELDQLRIAGVELLPDSGAVLVFDNNPSSPATLGMVFGRVDDAGNLQATSSFGESLNASTRFGRSIYTSADELAILGNRDSSGQVTHFLLFLDPQSLAVTSLYSLPVANSVPTFEGLLETSNGDFMLYGSIRDTSQVTHPTYSYLVRMDRQGNVIFSRAYKNGNSFNGKCHGLYEYAPDQFLLVQTNDDPMNLNPNNDLTKVNGQGQPIDVRKLDWDGLLELPEFFPLPNGNMVIWSQLTQSTSMGHSIDALSTVMIEMDTSLNLVYVRKFNAFSSCRFIQQDDTTYAMFALADCCKRSLVRINDQGQIQSAHLSEALPGTLGPYPGFLRRGPDGTLLFTSHMVDTTSVYLRNLLVVTDGTGEAPCFSRDTVLSPFVNFPVSAFQYSTGDTTYGQLVDSFPVPQGSYPNLFSYTLCAAACVWPGDANGDGTADLTDLLNLGIAYNSTGPARAAISNSWLCHTSTDWLQSFSGGLPYQHADCNGDGIVNAADTVAIQQNYGLSHFKVNGPLSVQSSDPILAVVIPEDSAYSGDTVFAHIILGDSTLIVDSIYGIAFRVFYDPALVDSGSMVLHFGSSWIGAPAQTLSLQRDNHSQGFIDGAIVRTDGFNVSGLGDIATLSFVLIDNIEGKRQASEVLPVQIGAYTAMDRAENMLVFSTGHDSLVVQDTTTLWPQLAPGQEFKVFPNPFHTKIQVQLTGTTARHWQVFDPMGKLLRQGSQHASTFSVSLPEMAAGLYLLRIETDKGILHKMLIK